MGKESIIKIADEIRDKDDFLIAAHVNPEGDSIGSQTAMYGMLRTLGKNAVMVGHDKVPENIRFLPHTADIKDSIPDGFKPGACIILDCPVLERIGRFAVKIKDDDLIINIDHHVSNEYFGDLNWVEPGASSAGEMIFHLAGELGLEVDQALAQALYTAILTDTGMFNYENTSEQTHRVAGRLLRAGINPRKVYTSIYENKSENELRLLARVLSTLRTGDDGKTAYMCLTRDMYRKEGGEYIPSDDFINYARSLKGVEVVAFFKEDKSTYKRVHVSFRSNETVDVNSLASTFGGGGHRKASGCVIEGSLEEAMGMVLARISEEFL